MEPIFLCSSLLYELNKELPANINSSLSVVSSITVVLHFYRASPCIAMTVLSMDVRSAMQFDNMQPSSGDDFDMLWPREKIVIADRASL